MAASTTFVAADGDGYERQMGRWSRRLAELFLDFVGTAAGETILDVGSGTGSLATALASRCEFARLLGVDFSSIYVAHAIRHCHDPRVTFAVSDACALDLPERSFDRVLTLLVLHFVPRTVMLRADEVIQ